jgi:hypothetical protein
MRPPVSLRATTQLPFKKHTQNAFSVLQSALVQSSPTRRVSQSENSTHRLEGHSDVEKRNAFNPQVHAVHHSSAGLTLYVRKSTGMTQYLRANNGLLTLLEGPYPNNSTKEIVRCDRVLLMAGGIGITGLIRFANSHWNVKLAWSVKESAKCLVDDLQAALSGIAAKDIRKARG